MTQYAEDFDEGDRCPLLIEDAEAAWREACKAYAESPDIDVPWDDAAATKVISAALDKARAEGRKEERARIAAWLRDQWRSDELDIEAMDYADMIEQGAHNASR